MVGRLLAHRIAVAGHRAPSSLSDLAEVSTYVVALSGWYTRGGGGMSNFRQVDRQTGFLLPPSVESGCRNDIWRALWWK